jgi:DNA invertase Pin-like site-specific DNA recombinase
VAGFEAQLRMLREAGCERVFKEQVSSVAARAELERAIEFVREGDSLIVTKLDRLARSTAHLLTVAEEHEGKRVALRVLDLNLDTTTATGRLLFTMIGAIAAFEREMMLERQREGIAKAKAEGRYAGRRPTIDASAVTALRAEGLGASEIARRLGIGRASVYRLGSL